jgi:hypothetical protein
MNSLLDLIKKLYGPKAISSTVGTRTNVVIFPKGDLQRYLSADLNIEGISKEAAKNTYLEMHDLIPYVSTMNDAERLIFEGNLRRLKNNLESHGLVEGENVSSGITSIQSEADQRKLKRREIERGPVNQEGLMGTNVATGIFSKPKEGKLAKDFLVSDVIGNPFEINYYQGRSREDILRSAEAQLKMIDDELANLTDQITNKNLQLTQEQKINFARNLETKKRFEKDFETFKTKPEAEVLDIETGKKIEDVETLKEKSGLVAPPTSPIGRIDLMNKQMLQRADELFPSEATLQKEEAKRQALIAKQYEGKGYAGGTFGPSGMYRSVARDFLLDQNAKGKIKLTDDVVKNLEERNYISGGQPLMYPDPIRVMRFHYGDDVFDKIPLDKIPTGARSEIIDAMSKVEANPVKIESPVTPGGYMTPGEMKANIDELKNIERMIKRRESRFADMTEEQIQNELEQYGSKRSSFEMAFQSDHPEAYETYLKKQEKGGDIKAALKNYSYREKPNQFYEFGKEPKMDVYHIAEDMAEYVYQKPFDELPQDLKSKLLDAANEEYINVLSIGDEGFAKGGSVGSKGLDYLTGMEPPKNGYAGGGRVNFEKGSIPKMLKFLIDKLADEKNFNKTLLEKSNPKAIQELYIEQYGKLPSAEEIKDIVNKQLQNKGSMEVTNPKTGEVTIPKNPIMTVEDLQFKHKDAFNAHDQISVDIGDKIAPDMIAESMAEMKGKDYFSLSQKEQSDLYKKALAYVDDVRMTKRQNKSLYVRGDAITEENFGNTPFAPSQETLDNLKKAREMTKGMSLEDEMNMVLNQYDKSMFIKNEQGMVDVTNPENVRKMALLLKRDHPELYRRLEAGMPQEKSTIPSTLKEFKKTSPEVYGEFSKSTNRMQELLNFRSGQETFETFDLETYNYLNSQEIGRLLNQLKNPYKISDKERDLVKTGFTRDNMEGTGLKNLDEINFRTDKKQLETYLDDLYNKKQVEEAETELFNLKDSGREPNAVGGRVGFEKGSIPEEEDEKPSEEYIKSREAGRFKYSFDVQGPDSRIRKSGLPGKTNPKDYGLGITYLSNPSNETAPEIRVGGSRRGAGIEIRKRFKEGGLGYLVGE